MDQQAAIKPDIEFETVDHSEQRSARRYSLLIRPAKLSSAHGELICVLRDVSRTGVSAKLFHKLPSGEQFTLELQNGHTYDMVKVWERDGEAGFEFANPVDVNALIAEASQYPKRGLRLALSFPVTVSAISGAHMAYVENISQQGARIECAGKLAIDQNIRIEGEGVRETRAKVRWRRGESYGVVFDDTFTLRDFAVLVAQLQCPVLFD
ncbi:hypothetical protein BPTFM16_02302 [Altererythrobacter insulae]|nr:hypothetical protein BPTFM16_02302 [Altererythrobacter insulae]